ncbi:hypothetical protein Q3G72_015542 [Acer saccharum]|nr:hypothetical protein Q3G72_015542 [Acer saccharum]
MAATIDCQNSPMHNKDEKKKKKKIVIVGSATQRKSLVSQAIANTLHCDSHSTMFEYVVSLVGRWMPEELEKALLTSIASCHQLTSSSSSLAQGQIHQQQLIFGY